MKQSLTVDWAHAERGSTLEEALTGNYIYRKRCLAGHCSLYKTDFTLSIKKRTGCQRHSTLDALHKVGVTY